MAVSTKGHYFGMNRIVSRRRGWNSAVLDRIVALSDAVRRGSKGGLFALDCPTRTGSRLRSCFVPVAVAQTPTTGQQANAGQTKAHKPACGVSRLKGLGHRRRMQGVGQLA